MLTQLRATAATFAIAVLAAGAIGTATPALARQNAQVEQLGNGAAAAPEKAARKTCRWVEQTGRNAKERICLTREDWKRVDEYLAKNP